MVLTAQSLLMFLELNGDLEECSMDVRREILSRIEKMLSEGNSTEELEEKKLRKEGPVPRIGHSLKNVLYCMKELTDVVFKDHTWLKTDERYQISANC